MSVFPNGIEIRPFRDEDAEICFLIRSRAFRDLFKEEIGEDAVIAGINTYQPSDYKQIARQTSFFIVQADQHPVGFFIIRRLDPKTAELVLIYLESDYMGQGLGSYCYRHCETWIRDHWKEVEKMIVDTVIPNYNARFYEKMGFVRQEMTNCRFPGKTIPALRLEKLLNRSYPADVDSALQGRLNSADQLDTAH